MLRQTAPAHDNDDPATMPDLKTVIPALDKSGWFLWRLKSVGFLADPNDFAQVLVMTLPMLWGAGWRHKRDEVVGGAPRFPSQFTSPHDRADLLNLFAQGELELVPERWALTLGARVDRPDDARLAFQPNARILFTPDPAHSLWASAARAVRAGSLGERTVSEQLPARPLESPLTLGGNTYTRLAPRISGNPDFGHEYLDALDLGWRASWSSRLSTELAAYHYRYDDLRHAHRGAPAPRWSRYRQLGRIIKPVSSGTDILCGVIITAGLWNVSGCGSMTRRKNTLIKC